MLVVEWDVVVDVWLVISWGELNCDGVIIEIEKFCYFDWLVGVFYVMRVLENVWGLVIVVLDWMCVVFE